MTHKENVHQVNLAWNRVPCRQSSSSKACHAIFYNILKGELRQNDLDEFLSHRKLIVNHSQSVITRKLHQYLHLTDLSSAVPSGGLSTIQY